jgi:dihydrofolate reductase
VRLTVVAAVAQGGVIGRSGTIPWRIAEDSRRFRNLTTDHPVIMGRRTWESLPDLFRPLPGRRNVVVTRNRAWSTGGAEHVGSLREALELLVAEQRVFVIGGAELYAEALPLADEVLLTEIDAVVEGDVRFPAFDKSAFDEVSREPHVAGDGTPFAFVTYRRRASAPTEASYPPSVKRITCVCGVVLEGEDDDELWAKAQEHIRVDHPDLVGKVLRQDLLAQAEEISRPT